MLNISYEQQSELIPAEEFEISETYRRLIKTSPGKSFIVYTINPIHFDLRGILMTS